MIRAGLAILALYCAYAIAAQGELDDQIAAAKHSEETRLAAREAAKQKARDLRWQGLLDDAERMTPPVAAYK